MYAHCVFCAAHLGRNEVLDAFPVGRRLAFDGARGRLWVVCRACERWNLSPLEERWEAIEQCESRFASTRTRVSTENVGLARLREGLELIRIGNPQRPELAVWRYGDQFGRRRRRRLLRVGAGLGILGAGVAGGFMAVGGLLVFGGGIARLSRRIIHGNPAEVVARVTLPEGGVRPVRRGELGNVRLSQAGDAWQLLLPGVRGLLELTGPPAWRAAASLMPHINRFGGTRRDVDRAVARLESAGSIDAFMLEAARRHRFESPPRIAEMTYPLRLAVEMAVHEDAERLALEGELAGLERAWREAEQLAAIADDLLLPRPVRAALDELRRR